MKKKFFILALPLILLSCSQDSINSEQQNSVKNPKLSVLDTFNAEKVDNNPFCRDFTVGINFGFGYIETEVTVCCYGPYGSIGAACSMSKGEQIRFDITDLLEKHEIDHLGTIEIISSSVVTLEDDTKIKIKTGKYKVNENNIVYLELGNETL